MYEDDLEKEARINALRQLLENTQADMIKAFEGRMTTTDYETLRASREAWQGELAALEETPSKMDSGQPGIMEMVIEVAVATVDIQCQLAMMEMGV